MTDADLALQQARQRLEQVERLAVVGQLAPGIAHELNTPLGVIISNLTVLAGYGDSLAQVVGGVRAPELDYILEALPALTSETIASANRISEIVRSLALLARNDAQRLGPVNVEDALQARTFAADVAGQFSLEVRDPILAPSGQSFEVQLADGRAHVQPFHGQADVQCEVATLSQIWSGALSATHAERYGLLEAAPAQIELWDRAFPVGPPYIARADWF